MKTGPYNLAKPFLVVNYREKLYYFSICHERPWNRAAIRKELLKL